jgi:hypothetical protein
MKIEKKIYFFKLLFNLIRDFAKIIPMFLFEKD